MNYQAILSKKTNDEIRSKILNQQSVQLILDVYMTPQQYASFVDTYFNEVFEMTLPDTTQED